jgi:hypothetical protein
MRRASLILLSLVLFVPGTVNAQDKEALIASAISAAPASVSHDATVMDWQQNVLRAGTNGWTCLPDMPDTPGNDPMCLDDPWLNWAHAWMTKTKPTYTEIGFGYMLRGGSPESNTDPYAEGPTSDNEWISDPVPHIMMIVPDPKVLDGLTDDAESGGPWVMWRGTPYVHVMIPTPKKSM